MLSSEVEQKYPETQHLAPVGGWFSRTTANKDDMSAAAAGGGDEAEVTSRPTERET